MGISIESRIIDDPKGICEALIYLLESFDCQRAPYKLFPRSFFYSLRQSLSFKNVINKHDPGFASEIDSLFRTINQKYRGRVLTPFYTFYVLIEGGVVTVFALALSAISAVFLPKFIGRNFIVLFVLVLSFVVGVIGGWLMFRVRRIRNNIGKLADEELKGATQRIVDYTREFIKKNNLYQIQFPIYLGHNDYEGLVYEEKGENNYIGYVKVD
jgi:hypothetical protein